MKELNQEFRRHAFAASEVQLREAAEGEESRTIVGRAIVFDVPSEPLWSDDEEEAREVISAKAITRELLDTSDIVFTLFHDNKLILARSNKGTGTLSYDIDEKGVSFSFDAPHTTDGEKALELVKRGDISGCSFAFTTRYFDSDFVTRDVEFVGDRKKITYTVERVTGLYDMTLTTNPAYSATSAETRELREKLAPTAKPEKPTSEAKEKHLRRLQQALEE